MKGKITMSVEIDGVTIARTTYLGNALPVSLDDPASLHGLLADTHSQLLNELAQRRTDMQH